MLHIIGLGLDDKEITEKAKERLETVDKAYAEFYTNTENINLEKLEEKTGTEIKKVSRDEVEKEDIILEKAKENDIAFLVSGDPLTATTHYDIKHRAEKQQIDVKVTHAPSIITSVAETGLNVYKFGRVVTLPKNATPESIKEHIGQNDSIGLHTLVLLDINFTADKAAEKLVELDEKLAERKAVIIERANKKSQKIQVKKISEIPESELGEPPHSIIIIGETSHKEKEFLQKHD